MVPPPYQVVRDFEFAVAEYTDAPFCVAVNSCTMALFLAMEAHGKLDQVIEIPQRTYVGVPMQAKHANLKIKFVDRYWEGFYQLNPLPVYDSARWFTRDLYRHVARGNGGCVCVSFHASKTLGIEQGGAILHDNAAIDTWFRRARFDGRTEGVAPAIDKFPHLGWHCYMSPSVAAQGLLKLSSLPRDNAPLPNDAYPDLSKLEIFK